MKALITGASSGIGREMAIYLSKLGYDLILVARNKEKLLELQQIVKTSTKLIVADLSDETKLKELYVLCKNDDIDIFINNAGFGLFGEFTETDINTEMNMIDVNIKAVHILTKYFLKEMVKRDKGYILNVASSASFGPGGPLMDTYYATKGYVTKLTMGIYEELRRKKSNVHVSVLCPGPVDTNFNNVANVKFNAKGLDARYVAKYAIDKMLKKKLMIIPGKRMKLSKFFSRFVSDKYALKVVYKFQKKKNG
jgi:hypothetical protein